MLSISSQVSLCALLSLNYRRLCSLSHRWRRIGEFLFITGCSMHDHDEEKRTQQNLFIRSGKSEAEVTNNRRLRSTRELQTTVLFVSCSTDCFNCHWELICSLSRSYVILLYCNCLSNAMHRQNIVPKTHILGAWIGISSQICEKFK